MHLWAFLGVAWLVPYALIAAWALRLLQRPRVNAALDACSGILLISLGARMALERRP